MNKIFAKLFRRFLHFKTPPWTVSNLLAFCTLPKIYKSFMREVLLCNAKFGSISLIYIDALGILKYCEDILQMIRISRLQELGVLSRGLRKSLNGQLLRDMLLLKRLSASIWSFNCLRLSIEIFQHWWKMERGTIYLTAK